MNNDLTPASIELRSRIRLALAMIPTAWPLDGFIHHNPLHGLTDLHFTKALSQGATLFGGGVWPTRLYLREQFKKGSLTRSSLRKTLPEAKVLQESPDTDHSLELDSQGYADIPALTLSKIFMAELLLDPPTPVFWNRDWQSSLPGEESEDPAWESIIDELFHSQEELGFSPDRKAIRDTLVSIGQKVSELHPHISPMRKPSITSFSPFTFKERSHGGHLFLEDGLLSDPIDHINSLINGISPDKFSLDRLKPTPLEWLDRLSGTSLVSRLDSAMSEAAAQFMDNGQAFWTLPEREKGFFAVFKKRWSDPLLAPGQISSCSGRLALLPDSPEEAMLHVLKEMGIPPSEWVALFYREFSFLPGWSGTIRWMSESHEHRSFPPIDPTEWISLRLCTEYLLGEPLTQSLWSVPFSRPALSALCKRYPEEAAIRLLGLHPDLPQEIAGKIEEATMQRPFNESSSGWEGLWDDLVASHCRNQPFIDLIIALSRLWTMEEGRLPDPATLTLEQVSLLARGFSMVNRERLPLWGLLALEHHYRLELLGQIASRPEKRVSPGGTPPKNQLLFCIDVRSESVRRHLEAIGPYETRGVAGFFGLPIAFRSFGATIFHRQSPPIVSPRIFLWELHRPFAVRSMRHFFQGRRIWRWMNHLLHELKNNVVTPYVLVEAIGWISGVPFFGRTLFPRRYGELAETITASVLPDVPTMVPLDKISEKEARDIVAQEQRQIIRQVIAEKYGKKDLPKIPGRAIEEFLFMILSSGHEGGNPQTTLGKLIGLTPKEEEDFVRDLREIHHLTPRMAANRIEELARVGLTPNEQANLAETVLTISGLRNNLGRLVLFLGHRSRSENNPFESALDCGACGGRDGSPNARVSAGLLNRPAVREILQKRGIIIPPDTFFMAGVHETTTDRFFFYDQEDWPESHLPEIGILIRDLRTAGTLSAMERQVTFPDASPQSPKMSQLSLVKRAHDWAEVRPEWGLSGNAALVIGNRSLTSGLNLSNRVFLQEYNHFEDPKGKWLETLLSGPMVVAWWINLEHYFSSVDPRVWGSGSKVSHNVTGRLGVVVGHEGDLRFGLPRQTVMDRNRKLRHDPLRLLVIVETSRERMSMALQASPAIRKVFDLEWATLVIKEPERTGFWRYEAGGSWIAEEIQPPIAF